MQPHPTIGFIILSHRRPEQLQRLVGALGQLYNNPPIVCHHDFGQAPLDTRLFPANLRFVSNWNKTGWGKWTVVDAFLKALGLLYTDDGPDWFALLSGADYPVSRAERVLSDMRDSSCDAFIDVHQIRPLLPKASIIGLTNPDLEFLETEKAKSVKWRFYLARQVWLPILRRTPRWRLGRFTIQLPIQDGSVFSHDFGLWWGEHWFTGNRRTAETLLNPTSKHLSLRRYLRWRPSVDECYYQTVLCNTHGLVINRDNKRFVKWNGGGAHPATLSSADVRCALSSGAHFARKFGDDQNVLDLIDQELGIVSRHAAADRR